MPLTCWQEVSNLGSPENIDLKSAEAGFEDWDPGQDSQDDGQDEQGSAESQRQDEELITLADIQPEAVEWIWTGYILAAKITDMIGNGDLGKTLVLLYIIARMTRGDPMPDNPNGPRREPIDVLLLAAEDDLADTLVPRLIAAGADMTRVHAPAGLITFPEDIPKLERWIEDKNIRLLVIDPIMAFMGVTKTGIEADVRKGLTNPLKELAARRRCAVVWLRHINKNERAGASMRGTGSTAFYNAARAGLTFGLDHDDETGEARIMIQSKRNLGKERPALRYRIVSTFGRVSPEGTEGTPVVEWLGVAEGATVASVLGPAPKESAPREGTKVHECTAWLRERLGHSSVAATVMWKEADEKGFCANTVKGAQRFAKVRTFKV